MFGGSGSMGAVTEQDLTLKKFVAVKFFIPMFERSSTGIARFEAENEQQENLTPTVRRH